jgi:hypothetical protein
MYGRGSSRSSRDCRAEGESVGLVAEVESLVLGLDYLELGLNCGLRTYCELVTRTH